MKLSPEDCTRVHDIVRNGHNVLTQRTQFLQDTQEREHADVMLKAAEKMVERLREVLGKTLNSK